MCRLLGIYGQVDGWRDIALEFAKLAESGMVPPVSVEPGHKDGWGMAASNNEGTAMREITRQLGPAHDCPGYRNAIGALEAQPRILLCHIRKASPGIPVTIGNVHPFFREPWAFIHNGTINDPENLPLDPSFELTSDGSDSERLFGFLLGLVSKTDKEQNITDVMADAIASLSINHSAINCMIGNGSELIAIRDYQRFGDYLSLYYCRRPKGVIVCSEPLEFTESSQPRWQLLANKSILRVSGSEPHIELLSYSNLDRSPAE